MSDSKTTVLVVDDSPDRLLIHSLILTKSGYSVTQATNGTDCMAALRAQVPDIVILDVVLPDINGIEICRTIKADERTRNALVLLISSIEIDSLDQSRGLDSGADGYLILPVKNQEFISRVRALERIKRSEDGLRDEVERHRRTVEMLRRSEEYARSIIDCSQDMIITVDTDRNIVEFNESAQRTFGYSKEEVVGRNVNMLYADDDEGRRVHLKTLGEGNVVREIRNRRKNGEFFTSLLAASVLKNHEGELLGLVGVSRDVSLQKRAEEALFQSEERYRLLFNEAPMGIVHLDAAGAVLNANAIAGLMLGKQPDELRSQRLAELLTNDQIGGVIGDALGGKHGFYEGEYRQSSDGRPYTLRIITRPLLASGGAVESVICIFEDITEQRNAQRQLVQAQKLESLGTLAGGIAHDFNNLLAMILGNAELLRKNLPEGHKAARYAESIIDVAHKGSSISRQMLLFSHPSELRLQTVRIFKVIDELRTMLQHFIPKTVDIRTETDGRQGCISCDIGHLHQVILNLCINAKDAMGDHGSLVLGDRVVPGSLVRERFPDAGADEYVQLTVTDTGVGMDESTLARIFDPFFTTKERGKGTGLGLSIVAGIVRSHRGFVDVISKVGGGSTFALYFPAVTEGQESHSTEKGPAAFAGKKVLVVDDEEVLLTILKEYLEEIGCGVVTACDGAQAVSIYRDRMNELDAVISDLGMPSMNGVEMFSEMRKLNPAVKVIISSGYTDGTFKSRMMKEGIVDVLNKPYRFEEIGEVLERTLRT